VLGTLFQMKSQDNNHALLQEDELLMAVPMVMGMPFKLRSDQW